MKDVPPRVPQSLHPLAREILEGLQGHPEARAIVLGGGVALQHYLDYRTTVDLDAWWGEGARPDVESLLRRVLAAVAARHGLELGERQAGHSMTRSFELKEKGRKLFSFQIAPRDVELEAPRASAWPPVQLETLRDNLGAKMNALVGRGAPRDFLDVHALCQAGIARVEECWQTWREKNPGADIVQAKVTVLEHLSALEGRRPLEKIESGVEREAARGLRLWARSVLCAAEKP